MSIIGIILLAKEILGLFSIKKIVVRVLSSVQTPQPNKQWQFSTSVSQLVTRLQNPFPQMSTLGFSPKTTPQNQALQNLRPRRPRRLISGITPRMSMAATTPAASFGFKNLTETSVVSVQRAESRPLSVPLIAPFTIATSRLERVENVAVRIELSNGCGGWGEIPILPFVTAEDQPTAMAKAAEACQMLRRNNKMTLGAALAEIAGILPGHDFASVSLLGFFIAPFCFFCFKVYFFIFRKHCLLSFLLNTGMLFFFFKDILFTSLGRVY